MSSPVEQPGLLRESDERFRAFVTATSDVVYLMNADWSELRQLSGREFIADTSEPSHSWIERYIAREDQPEVLAAIRKAIETKSAFELVHRIIRLDGTMGWTFSRAIPILGASGDIVEWFGTARDITDQRRADEVVSRLTAYSERQRRLYQTVLSNTPDLIYVFDLDHRFSYANDALLAMWGKTWHEAIGKNCLELGYEPWHAEMHDREIDQVIATKQPIRGEVPFNGTNGRRFYDYIFTPVVGEDGEVEAIAGTTRDITERKQAEDTLRDRESRLAEANRAKDEFLATLSHELRTPLNAVLGWTHMLRTGALRPELAQRAFESLERNAKAQAKLVDDLLDVSRITSGKLPLYGEPVDLAVIIASAVDAVRPAAAAKNLQLRVGVDDSAPAIVQGDGGRLQQVIWNLLSNAVKFTPDGGTVDVDLRVVESDAEIAVRDSGEGIAPDFLPHVFERFRQADSRPSRKHGGLGLGLAIVHHLVELHGGTVTAHSDGPDTGSTFVVRLPLQAKAQESRLQSERASTPAPITDLRILVVDDEAEVRELVRAVLENAGARVVTAGSVDDALQALRHGRFDVVVADVSMPEQDGYALIRSVRHLPDPDAARVPAVAVTAFAGQHEREDAIAAGFNWHVAKPLSPAELVAAVAMVMQA